MFEKIVDAIKTHARVIIHRHSHPDGDALGSQLGLAQLIRDNYPDKTVYVVGDGAGRYAFMAGSTMDNIPDTAYDGALAIVLDSATEELVSDKRFKRAALTARIDHHLYCEKFTELEVVDPSFESASGMVAELAREQGWTVSRAAAAAIFTGMVTDSGRFRYDSTSARTFELAAMLSATGVDTEAIYRDLYARDLESVQRQADFIRKIRIFEHSPVAYIYNTVAEVKATGLEPETVSRGMVNIMSDIKGIDIWVNFTEREGAAVLCELRSSRYNINPVAVKYGGGGHKKASGADVADFAMAMEMLKDLKALTEAGEQYGTAGCGN